MDASTLDAIDALIRSQTAVLFTGAGFSCDARDRNGRPLPDGPTMASELWRLCFSDEEPDDSSLPDLCDVALHAAADALAGYLRERLCIGDAPLPSHLAWWLAAPWRCVYARDVDNLEQAIGREYLLPRQLRTISALVDEPPSGRGSRSST